MGSIELTRPDARPAPEHRGARASDAAIETGSVVALTHEGAGVIRGGKTVFVPGALPGERIRFERIRRRRQHDEGRIIELLEPATDRVEPRCAHFGVCGGCSLQHLSGGIGNFTLPLARRADRVVGVEGDAQLIARARHNACRNGIANAEFHTADLAAAVTAGTPWLLPAYTHVLLDPPRAGAQEMLPTLAHFNPQRVLYISCHPGSLARDIGMLVHDHGFILRAAGVLDMFPHTAHVESLAVLEPARRGERGT